MAQNFIECSPDAGYWNHEQMDNLAADGIRC
jgi:hypothetical protein